MKNDLWFSASFICIVTFKHAVNFSFSVIKYNMMLTLILLSNIVSTLSFSILTEYFRSFTAQKSFKLDNSFIIFSETMIISFFFISNFFWSFWLTNSETSSYILLVRISASFSQWCCQFLDSWVISKFFQKFQKILSSVSLTTFFFLM